MCPPLSRLPHIPPLQYSVPVLSRHGGATVPVHMAAHIHPRAALGDARHRLHPDPVHRRAAVRLPAAAH